MTKKEYVDSITEDVKYLGIKPNATLFVSNDMPKLYSMAERLIKKGMAYVCFCTRDKMQKLRHKAIPCGCREKEAAINMEEWNNMLSKLYKEAECVLRLRGDLEAANQVMRDPVIFRISYERHFLQGNRYCVWPLYDFENAVEDGMYGITHIMRSIEFGEMRVELQDYIKELLNLPKQRVVQYGRFNVTGAATQGRLIREQIDTGKLSGWDDPRLVTIKALRRRGIQPGTFRELAVEVGLSTTPTNIDWSVIASYNRKILDPICNRYFFVPNPKKIVIEGAPDRIVDVKLHPDSPERGSRKFNVSNEFYITDKDAKSIGNELVRLMDCLNFRKTLSRFVFDSLEYERYKKGGKRIIQWLPVSENNIAAEILMPDASITEGLAEAAIEKLKIGDIVQFVRFGFCKLEKKEKNKLIFIYTHD
jgi:glutamyl-tRNA synthetase